jgi:quercetin dioxygenase-like cupin family protein
VQTGAMATLIEAPTVIPSPGSPPKQIAEFVGRVTTGEAGISIAEMKSPTGWVEPGQRPEFDEYTVVLTGELVVETVGGTITVRAGQAVHCAPGEWVRYSTPAEGGAYYVSVCIPGFSPDTVHRDTED